MTSSDSPSRDTPSRYALAPDFTISRVLTGLWQVADLERTGQLPPREQAARSLLPYAHAGFTTFDMADHYGSAEDIVGHYRAQAMGPAVESLTKWVPEPGPITREQVRAAVDRARGRLHVERIDLLQFHAWAYTHPGWLDAMFYLDELRREGLIRHLGVTNTDTAHLRVLVESGVRIVSNQICYSLLDQRAAGAMAEYCQSQGIAILAFGTLAGGFLSDRWLGRAEPDWNALETWSQMKYGRFIRAAGGWEALQRVLQVARAIANKHGASIANVAARAILDAPAVGGVIVGARLGQRTHIEDNARVDGLRLDASDREALANVLQTLQPIDGDCGDEYRKPPFLTASGDLSHHVAGFPAPYPVRVDADGRRRALSGTLWETLAGYSRAVRVGDRILVSGTTATHGERVIGGSDPAAQTHFVIDKIAGAIESLGGQLEDVVRTRVFVSDLAHWEPVARAHGVRFANIQPANTMVRAELIGHEYLVEIEAEAIVHAR
jgi:aryl-alcohol dehydrogenase-like predicted oxidoreductase/enamine deaminase RidA (YjgF/YER057c/UK114 family)